MQGNNPYISIVTPSWNSEKTIRRTLDSLQQQKASFEHILKDGGSSDHTVEIAQEYVNRYPLQIYSGKDRGIYDAIDEGFRLARGEILAWINSDDLYFPFTLAMVERIFRAYPDVEWITGVPTRHWDGKEVLSICGYVPIYNRTAIKMGLHHGKCLGYLQQESMFWRRSLFDRAKGNLVLGKYRYAADFQLWKAFAQHAQLHTVRSVFSTFTIREGQISEVQKLEYDKECGISPRTPMLWGVGKVVNRLYSNLKTKRALYPEDLL